MVPSVRHLSISAMARVELRVQDKITSHSEGQLYHYLRTRLNREILNVSRIRLRFRSIVASESNDSFTPNPAKYFCPGPLATFLPFLVAREGIPGEMQGVELAPGLHLIVV